MIMMLNSFKKCGFSGWLLLGALVLVGGFYEYVSCLLTVAMCVYLLLRMKKTGKLMVARDYWTSAAVAICLGYGLTCLWAVDRGMAFVGFLKFLPLLLYVICLRQEARTDALETLLPLWGAMMAALSAVLMQIPACKQWFSVSGRLAGFFQYPNTFAVFLLVCQLMVLKKKDKGVWDYILMAVLVAGLLYTGSRTAFVVAVLANAAMLLSVSSRKTRLLLLGAMALAVAAVILLALNENSVLHRYVTISLTQSTFVGRLLYWADALRLLLKYPFGMGYMGYFYAQGSIQTGVYSVAYVHNDFLQLLLDVGFLPAGLLIGGLIAWFFRKNVPAADKILAGAVCLHSVFDFDLQYIAMLMLLFYLVSGQENKPDMKLKAKLPGKAGLAAVAAVAMYMAVPLLLANWGVNKLSDALYPWNTQNQLTMLEQETDLEQADALADRILARNDRYYAPYTVKAKYSYSKGEVNDLIRYKHEAFQRNPFNHLEYEEYCQMLMSIWELYRKAGDTQSADTCLKEMAAAGQLLEQNRDRLSSLGKLIDDQPVTALSEEVRRFISQNGGGK